MFRYRRKIQLEVPRPREEREIYRLLREASLLPQNDPRRLVLGGQAKAIDEKLTDKLMLIMLFQGMMAGHWASLDERYGYDDA
jgi:hypothetical protein